jgi:hypothetical protein
MELNVLLVVPERSGGWEVKRDNGHQLLHAMTRQTAQSFAAQWAQSCRPCQIKVLSPTGETRHTTLYA